MTTANILSIDAWGNKNEGYDWNSWHKVGTIDKGMLDYLTNSEHYDNAAQDRNLITYMIENGYIKAGSEELVSVEDDQYNIVFCAKESGEPFFAIEYGPLYS